MKGYFVCIARQAPFIGEGAISDKIFLFMKDKIEYKIGI